MKRDLKPGMSTLITVVLLVFLPVLVPSYWIYVLTIGFYYALLSSSWSLLAGQTGIISFAHVALSAVGAYTSALLVLNLHWAIPLGIVAGGLVAAAVGLGIGFLCLRMRGPYLALTTIAFSEILRITLNAEYQWTGGAQGLNVPPLFSSGSRLLYYYLMLALLISVLGGLHLILRSRLGLFFRAIREDEDAAMMRGVSVVTYKVLAFVITSFVAGLAGAVYGHFILLVSPQMVIIPEMGLVLSMAVIGGLESLLGAALGGVVLQFLLEYLRAWTEWRLVLFGGIVLLTLRFLPNGLLVELNRHAVWLWKRVRGRSEGLNGDLERRGDVDLES